MAFESTLLYGLMTQGTGNSIVNPLASDVSIDRIISRPRLKAPNKDESA